jgi:ABC-2 type transport system ATP-binding protein
MNIIDINQVSKVLGKGSHSIRAVDNLDLSISAGQVFGFLGPNGAGKSTTIRMMLGLIRPTKGHVSLFGKDVREQTNGVVKTGALVESAMFYPFLTGRENLVALGLSMGRKDKSRIDWLLSKVGMLNRADRRVSDYSTGMKQRLGIAAALLPDPELVILDEPTNGLDPAGIIEIREFIRSLAVDEGKTVFLSSHLLTEVEQVCDRVAIINKGKLVREGIIPDMLSETGSELCLEVSDPGQAAVLLEGRWEAHRMDQPGWLRVNIMPADNARFIRHLVENGVDVHQAVVAKQSLEELFLSLTDQEEGRD